MVTKGVTRGITFGVGVGVGIAGLLIVRRLLFPAAQGGSVYRVSQFIPPRAAESLLVID